MWETDQLHEALEKIRVYLEFRRRSGEDVGGHSFLSASAGGNQTELGNAVKYEGLRKMWRHLLVDAGLNTRSDGWRVLHLHTLRKYSHTQCGVSGMTQPMVELLIGHKGRGIDPSCFRPREHVVLEA